MRRASRGWALCLGLLFALLCAAGPAAAAPLSHDARVTVSDGASLQATVTGEAPLRARPTVVEFSPYGPGTATADPGPRFNRLLVQIRGTGSSDGRFDALGPRTQADVADVLAWACRQPFSDGRLGLNGFSASAIAIYNSLHLRLPCVEAAVLKSGTHELYRDLLYPGGVSNLAAGAGVLGLIGGAAALQAPGRLLREPASGLDTLQGIEGTGLRALAHPTLDGFWRERGMRGNVNHIPTLVINGFFDVESRGAFEGFRALRRDGARLMVIGAHDGAPQGTDGGTGATRDWFEHHLSGADNGVERRPEVQLWLADGGREELAAGRFVRYDGEDWPIRGTRWTSLSLDPTRSGTARSLNDGSLRLAASAAAREQSYPALPSLPTNTDQPNTSLLGAGGLDALTSALPPLGDMTLAEPLGLSYTTQPLRDDVLSAGPATLDVRLASTAPETPIWAVVSDVSPDGTPHPVATGRLLSSFPGVDEARSLTDPRSGAIVQPYGRYDRKDRATPGEARRYRVELWPIGNRFRAGHRIRLHIVGASAASLPGVPAVNTVTAGGPDGSRLLLPVLPGSDLSAALGGR